MNKQIKLLKAPYKAGTRKNSPMIFTVDDGTPEGVEMRTRDLQKLAGICDTIILDRLRDGVPWNDPLLLTKSGLVAGWNNATEKETVRKYKVPNPTLRALKAYVGRCPILDGASSTVRMTERGFKRMCHKIRNSDQKNFAFKSGKEGRPVCLKCTMEKPAEIEFISEEEIAEVSKICRCRVARDNALKAKMLLGAR